MKFSLILAFAICCSKLEAQRIQILTDNNKTSIRGLSVVNDKTVWVSGSNGTVGKSLDGGKTWKWITVKKFEKKDFRDIEAFDERTAIIMAIGEPALILKTRDGGNTWKTVFKDSTKGMFLDAMDFLDDKHGIVIGDPIKGSAFFANTDNKGSTWKVMTNPGLFFLTDGEALFASSGTNIKVLMDNNRKSLSFIFVTGGKKSRVFSFDPGKELDMLQGEQSQGANSIAIDIKSRKGVIVGGDFLKDTISKGNCVLFSLDNEIIGKDFELPAKPPHGYKSCVEYITENKLICCGTSGVDVSEDGGKNWRFISSGSFHVCQKAKNGNSVFLAGINGKIARLNW